MDNYAVIMTAAVLIAMFFYSKALHDSNCEDIHFLLEILRQQMDATEKLERRIDEIERRKQW